MLQPAAASGGTYPNDEIGRTAKVSETLDAAIIMPKDPSVIIAFIKDIGSAVFETVEPEAWPPQKVKKVGAASGLTEGTVYSTMVEPVVNPEGVREIMIESDINNPFTVGDDSGSLYVLDDPNNESKYPRVIALHHSGFDFPLAGKSYSKGSYMSDIFDKLNVGTICSGMFRNLLNSQTSRSLSVKGNGAPFDFSREFEAELINGAKGKLWIEAIENRREEILLLLLNPNGRAAASYAFEQLFNGKESLEEIMDTPLAGEQVEPFVQLVELAEVICPTMGDFLEITASIFSDGAGKTLRELVA